MSDIRIQRFQHRAKLPGAAAADRARIDRAMAEMLDGGLESALLHAGVDTDEEICIKRFVTRTHLNLSRSDLQLTADWSTAWVDALCALLNGGGDDVVRYRSRQHVLVDVAMRLLRGDHSRVWAWRQLGAWSATPPGAPEAMVELVRVLARDPAAVMPVCRALAQARLLGSWIARLPAASQRALAGAALRAAEVEPGARIFEAAPERADSPSAHVARFMATSPLLAELAPIAQPDNAGALAVLALLAAEPAALRGREVEQVVAEAGRVLLAHPRRAGLVEGAMADTARKRAGRHGAAARAAGPKWPQEQAAARAPAAAARTECAAAALPAHADAAGAVRASATRSMRAASMGSMPEHTTAEVQAAQAPRAQQAALRVHGHTEFGGLMYLLWLVEPSGVLDAVGGEQPLAVRGLRWVLRQVALRLLPLESADPVLHSFAGISPDMQFDGRPATAAESADIAALADRMVALLRARLGDPQQARDYLLDRVCRRPADLHFEPGWIELRFRLDAASTDVRRAGLDRDLGWLAWLGTVVKFSYV